MNRIVARHGNVVHATFGDTVQRAHVLYLKADAVDDPKLAMPLYREALQLNEKFDPAWTNLGNCLYDLGRIKEALDCYRTAIGLNPRQCEAQFNIGSILVETKSDFHEAELRLKCAIDCDPKFVDSYYVLGALYLRRGDTRNAKTYLKQFVRMVPDHAFASDVREILKGGSREIDPFP